MSSDLDVLKGEIDKEMAAIQQIVDRYQKKLDELKKFLRYIEKKGEL